MTGVLDEVQEKFLGLKFNFPAKEDFKEIDLETFWIKYLPVHLLISHKTLRFLTMFRSIYIYLIAFSTLFAVKTKYRNRLYIEKNLRCALASIQTHIQDLVAKKQCQVSH